jgi:hypothetical protein
MRGSFVLAAAGSLILAATAVAQQAPTVPAGYTPYVLQGAGVNTPPLPLKVEGDRIVAPEGGMVTVTDSRLTGDRVSMTLETPMGSMSFVGVRDGDVFAGFMFQRGERPCATPVSLVPAGRQTDLALDPIVLATAHGISRVEIVPGNVTLKSGEPRAFVARVFDESGTEITDPEVEWFSSGGTIMPEGEFTGINPDGRTIVALVNGTAVGTTEVTVESPAIASLTVFTEVPSRLAVGSRVPLEVTR